MPPLGSIVGALTKVLIIEDDNVIADGMARHLSAGGFDPIVVGRGELGLTRLPEPADVADALATALCHYYLLKTPLREES